MDRHLVQGLKSIVLTSGDPKKLAEFYRTVLEIPLERDEHAGVGTHWACQFGGLHFAIHPAEGFWQGSGKAGLPDTFLAFTIESLPDFQARLDSLGVQTLSKRDIGRMKFVSFKDPDGRTVSCGTPWKA